MTRAAPGNVVCLLLLCAAGSVSTRARAQVNAQDHATGYALFEQGRALARAQKFAEACPKFEESQHLDAGIGTLFNLADCYEHIGRTASAWSNFREVADSAAHDGQSVRAKAANERAARLVPRLSHLTNVPSGNDVTLQLDTTLLGAGALGAPLPIDPGPHTLVASAPGKKSWSSKIEIADGASITVSLPALLDETGAPPLPASPPPVAPAQTPAITPAPAPAPAPPPIAPLPPTHGWQRPTGIALTGLGAVGLGVGAFLGLRAHSQWSSAKAHCPSTGCTDPTAYESWQSAHSNATASTVLFVAGSAVLATGLVLWISAPAASSPVRVGLGANHVELGLDF